MNKRWLEILEEFDWPPIYLIPPLQFSMIEGEGKKEENTVSEVIWGLSASKYPVITINPWLRGKARDNTLYHEIAHHLWPKKPHWWIDLFGEKMAGGGGRGYWARQADKTPDDLPPRNQLLIVARRQVKRLKEKYKIVR